MNINSILFWKRDCNSINKTTKCYINVLENTALIDNIKHIVDAKDISSLINLLFSDLNIAKTDEEFLAFQYENKEQDYSIKFFLQINYENKTYLAIKGIKPFNQSNYNEIIKAFDDFINKIKEN